MHNVRFSGVVQLGVSPICLFLLLCAAFAGETPGKMTHAIIQMSGSGIAADSFFSKA